MVIVKQFPNLRNNIGAPLIGVAQENDFASSDPILMSSMKAQVVKTIPSQCYQNLKRQRGTDASVSRVSRSIDENEYDTVGNNQIDLGYDAENQYE